MRQSLEILNFFKAITFKQIFWKTKILSIIFLAEITKIEKETFPYKNALSVVSVKTNRMRSTNWTYHKEKSFSSNYFIILGILFQFTNLLQRIDLMHQLPKCPYSYFSLVLEFYP